MVVDLDVGYCDTRAEDLGWSLELEPRPALAVRELAEAGFLIQLRLLGASHQVVVRVADPDSQADPRQGPQPGSQFGPQYVPQPGSRSGPDSAPPGTAPVCLETLACIPDRTRPVPSGATVALGRWEYTFNSHTARHGPAEFDGLIGGIERESRSGILGRYPGAPGAVTAISLRSEGRTLHWSTWHTYPQQGSIVTTHSMLRARTE
jgi:Protein of unknown function DUF2617